MTWPAGDHMCLERHPDQCKVADHIEQFMPGRFIWDISAPGYSGYLLSGPRHGVC